MSGNRERLLGVAFLGLSLRTIATCRTAGKTSALTTAQDRGPRCTWEGAGPSSRLGTQRAAAWCRHLWEPEHCPGRGLTSEDAEQCGQVTHLFLALGAEEEPSS